MSDLDSIIYYQERNPSMCWKCAWGRSVSTNLLDKGWCGCGYPKEKMGSLPSKPEPDNEKALEFKSGLECEGFSLGWIKEERPCLTFPQSDYGCYSNFQPVVKSVTKCKYYLSNLNS